MDDDGSDEGEQEQHGGFDNIWSQSQLEQHIQKEYGQLKMFKDMDNIFVKHVRPKMEKQVVASAQCVQEDIENRKNSFQLFGYDFMIDQDLNCWLIEVNSSPSMGIDNPVLHRMVSAVQRDMVKVVVEWHDRPNKDMKVDTGKFKLLYKSISGDIDRAMKNNRRDKDVDLVIRGKKCRKFFQPFMPL